MIVQPLVSPVLVARSEELAELAERRRAASRGHGSLVLISGDAGIGKSRLVAAFRETLSNGRAAIGVGLCREVGNVPYAPLTDAVRALGLTAAIPSAASRPEQLAAMTAAIRRACERRNAVLILEDLHWADEGTLSFLGHLSPAIGPMRLLVVATYRSDEVRGAQAAAPSIARLVRARGNAHLALRPLRPADTRSLLRHAIAGRASLDSAELEQIVERSEGNPFFAEELLTGALERRERGGRAMELPLTIRSAVAERLGALDAASRRVLVVAAVLGRRFEAQLLAEIAELPLPEILAVLHGARDLQLIDELRTASNAIVYAFRHALIRDAIYDEMLALELRPLHARILAALELRDGASANDLGYHAWAALDAERCVLYNERAGDEADALHSYADAIACYERAMFGAQDGTVRARILEKAARSCGRDGKPTRAMRLYEAAAEERERVGDAAGLVELYQAMCSEARLAGDNERAMTILRRALPSADPLSRAALDLTEAFLHLDRGEMTTSRALIDGARVASNTPLYWNVRCYAAMMGGEADELRAAAARHIELCVPLGADRELRARFNLGFALCVLGEDAAAVAQLDAILPELQARRLSSLEVLACANAALIHARGGRLRNARALVQRGLSVPEPTTTGPIALAAAALEVGRAASDDALVGRCVKDELIEAAFTSHINTTLGRLAGAYARWLHARGEQRAARDVVRRAIRTVSVPAGATETILAALELGDATARDAALALLPAIDALGDLPLYAATADHLRALGAARAGDDTYARTSARAASARYRAMGWVLHEARCLEIAGEPAAASALFRRAEAWADVRRIESLHPVRGPEPTALSRRELEIAKLVAAGTPNKRLAERLDVSQRTVEKHLTSIYEKLGLRNRSELAAFVARIAPDATMTADLQS